MNTCGDCKHYDHGYCLRFGKDRTGAFAPACDDFESSARMVARKFIEMLNNE